MGKYKGNVGNLMQHWTLCEVLEAAQEHATGLSFIDAHAMAPLAGTRTGQDTAFDSVKDALPGQKSVYEQAWYRLLPEQHDAYPNSAVLVQAVWKGDYSMLLCEKEPGTADEIDSWLPGARKSPKCKAANLFRGDWRARFEKGLPSPNTAGLPDGSLSLVSFDPYMCSRHSPRRQPAGNLYPNDLKLAVCALDGVRGGVLVQLSTYSANGDNPQESSHILSQLDPAEWGVHAGGCSENQREHDVTCLFARRWLGGSTSLGCLGGSMSGCGLRT